MIEIHSVKYKCQVCEETFSSAEEALECEVKEITQDKGVKVGDEILIISGEGALSKGKVTNKWVAGKTYGHYYWKRYWHTIGISVDIIGGWGSRNLTFDDYEVINKRDK